MKKNQTGLKAVSLADYFHRNGYVRKPSEERRETDGPAYRKGHEVRLVANTRIELRDMQLKLKAAGFDPGAAYSRNHQYIQPLYGRAAVTKFLRLVQRPGRK